MVSNGVRWQFLRVSQQAETHTKLRTQFHNAALFLSEASEHVAKSVLIRISSATIHSRGRDSCSGLVFACIKVLDGGFAWCPLTSEFGSTGLKQAMLLRCFCEVFLCFLLGHLRAWSWARRQSAQKFMGGLWAVQTGLGSFRVILGDLCNICKSRKAA